VVHIPLVQTSVARQAVPQEPQLVASVCVDLHTPLHAVCPEGHTQTLFTHDWLEPHVAPHAPQFVLLVAVSTQRPPQSVSPAGHLHTPFVQLCPALHALRHVPQLATSVERSRHALSQNS
jgi:hypothetical protein